MDAITLNCLVKGDDPYENCFEIEINKTKTINALKKAIKGEQKNTFATIDAHQLKLWKVNISLSESNEKLNLLNNRSHAMIEEGLEGIKLLASEDVQDYFKQPTKKHIHIIVECPPESTISSSQEVQELRERLATLQTSKVISLSSDGWEDFPQLFSRLKEAFDNLRGALDLHKFVISNKEINFFLPKKKFIKFIEMHKCTVNNPIRIFVRQGIKRSYMNTLGALPPPSSIGIPKEWFKRQKTGPFCLNRRPPSAYSTIPVSLFCLTFGKFKDFCEEVPEGVDNLFTYNFCCKMAEFYNSKEDRQLMANKMLSDYFKRPVQPITLYGNRSTDGTICYSSSNTYRELNIEYKCEFCSSNACPHLENCGYYLAFCKEHENHPSFSVTNFPCFLVVISGPYFSVSGAVFSNIAIVDPLTPVYPLVWHKDDEMMVSISRTFRALKKSLQLLDQYYKEVDKLIQENPQTVHPINPSFPKVTIDNKSYSVYINDQVGIYLLWEVVLFDEQDLCKKAYVKAVKKHKYSLDTHQLLAKVGYSPKVLAVSYIPGNWLLVYMEYLDQHSILSQITSILNVHERNSLRITIENIVKYLHNSEHVHGDLREGNILIYQSKNNNFDVKLIDFEWSGKVGFARYSHFMNHIDIQWPDGAEDGKLVTKDHDIFMLNRTFQITNLLQD
ncbi:hypothetical protein Glove_274g2 [Diversispora epigaea]|uniref:Protein kinase domain-containing protein n=1 Tax=Diversispora epigaea TaxID=1348612 RepID=A0A397IA18_9GLOM|nr:hypothetical protein Glove_274g2 [Diversispora epigaea]